MPAPAVLEVAHRVHVASGVLNSTEGRLNLEGIKITAIGPNGETFSVLTDNFGHYVLSVPQAPVYTISVANVFGEYFTAEMDHYEISFGNMKSISLDIKFIEKERGIKIREGEEFYEFRNSDPGSSRPLQEQLQVPRR